MKKILQPWAYINHFLIKIIDRQNNHIKFERKNELVLFHLGAPQHSNIGDLAIFLAQQNFLAERFPQFTIVPVTEEQINRAFTDLEQLVQPGDVLAFHGGGNMGDLWPGHEKMRQKVFSTFTNNVVFSFPQSVRFDDPDFEQESREAYNANPNLSLMLRDEVSLQKAAEFFDGPKFLTPDIVLQYKFDEQPERKNDVIVLMRKDKERQVDARKDALVAHLAWSHQVTWSDTMTNHLVVVPNSWRERIVKNKLREIAKHKLVVTDRLHGMIFGIITHTPVVVFDNNNHKIRNLYVKWLAGRVQNVVMVEDESLDEILPKALALLTVENEAAPDFTADFAEVTAYLKEQIAGQTHGES
ncbi:MAG: polysaccharide pyruvyl transferase family protein [Lactobacillaceae bacterium]|jgi:exopolysaccharide biosynthesis predicted pyruvyltransferase EpsI|nr:polysaccharide pyruvyl transferase family protein [Lactobacillaceae bacterium]